MSREVYFPDAGTTDFTVTYPYLDKDHIEVYQNGSLLTEGTHYTHPHASVVRLVTGTVADDVIVLQRNTSQSARLVDFAAGVLDEDDLDESALQHFYMAQEAIVEVKLLAVLKDTDENFNAILARIINVAQATASSDAASKAYVDSAASGTLLSALQIVDGGTGATTAAGVLTSLEVSEVVKYGEVYMDGSHNKAYAGTEALDMGGIFGRTETGPTDGVTVVTDETTAPITMAFSGKWLANAFIQFSSAFNQTPDSVIDLDFEFRVNDLSVGRQAFVFGNGDSESTSRDGLFKMQQILDLTAGDTVEVYITENNSDPSIQFAATTSTSIVMFLMEPS